MTDNKLTDNEIIKALEVCVGIHNYCGNCPLLEYSQVTDECMTEAMNNALDLINRQNAEIDRLIEENKKNKAVIEQIDDIINPLPFVTDFDKAIKNAKVETIKKFKQTVRTLFRLTFLRRKCYDKIFDEAEQMLLKEMAGETE